MKLHFFQVVLGLSGLYIVQTEPRVTKSNLYLELHKVNKFIVAR